MCVRLSYHPARHFSSLCIFTQLSNRFAIQHRIQLQTTLSFFDRYFAPSLLFYRWRDNTRKSKALIHLDALALFFVVRKHFIVWRGEGKTKWMPKLLPGPAAAVFSGILNLSKSLNLSIGSSISAGAAAQAVGSAFSAAFGFMSSPGMKRRRVGDSKEGLGKEKGGAVVAGGGDALTASESPPVTLPAKASLGGNAIDTSGAATTGVSTTGATAAVAAVGTSSLETGAVAVTTLPTDANTGTGPGLIPTSDNQLTPSAGTSSVDTKQAITEAERVRRKRLLAAMGDDES